MRSNKQPTAAQKRFWDWAAAQGCVKCGAESAIHHCAGSTAKHNKVEIGGWFCLPLCYLHHQHPQTGIHATPEWLGDLTRKEWEKKEWLDLAFDYITDTGQTIPPEVIDAICDYKK